MALPILTSREAGDRTHWGLLAVVVVSGALMAAIGSVAEISYDGWWHLFIARQEELFAREVLSNAHPPLYFLLLDAAAALGDGRLLYRSVGIAAAAVSTLLVGRILEAASCSRSIVLLGALAFGTSITVATIANALRSYALAGVFVLGALLCALRLLSTESQRSGRGVLLFSLWLSLAVLSHYAVLLVLPLFVLVPLLLAPTAPRRARAALLALLPPTLLALLAYAVHVRRFAGQMSHLPAHYPAANETLWAYVYRAGTAELNLLAPFSLETTPVIVQAAMLTLGCLFALGGPLLVRKQPARLFVVLLFTLLVSETFIASVFGRYPFGGMLRHQYLVFVLGIVASFVLVDQVVSRISSAPRRRSCVALLFVVLLALAIGRWGAHPISRVDRVAQQYRDVLEYVPADSAVFVGQASLIPIYAHHHGSRWRSVERVPGTAVDAWRVEAAPTERTVYRSFSSWVLSFGDPTTYRHIRELFDAGRGENEITAVEVRNLGTFRKRQWRTPEFQARFRTRMRELARKHGLAVIEAHVSADHVVARFQRAAGPT